MKKLRSLAFALALALAFAFVLVLPSGLRAQAQAPAAAGAMPPNPVTASPNPPTQGEGFGAALALDGDTLVVGASTADVEGREKQGAAVIFTRDAGGQWQPVKRLTVTDGAAFDEFGSAVAVQGDVVVVGAPYAESAAGATDQGAAYVFARNEGGPDNWGLVKKLAAGDGGKFDNFGSALALHGDALFVTAPNHLSGRVYHYRRALGGDNAWGEAQAIKDAQAREHDEFGSAVAFDGATLVVGAARSDITGFATNDGVTFVFALDAATDQWQQVAKLSAGDASDSDRFGGAVALSGGVIAVGAPAAEGPGDMLIAGKVYVFEGSGASWPQTAVLTPSDPTSAAFFGETLAATPQGIVVYSACDNGVLYVYQPAAAAASAGAAAQPGWQQTARYAADSTFLDSGYGRVLATDATRLAIGAPQLDLDTGSVYVHALADIFAVMPEPPQPTLANVYLPLLSKRGPPLPTIGQLVAGGKLLLPDGAGVAAPVGSISAPVNLALQATAAPALAQSPSATVVGSYYLLGADVTVSTSITQPLLLALPVPAGVDPTHLALAVLTQPSEVWDADTATEPAWAYYEGNYDAAAHRFVTTWPFLSPQGATMVLVQHPDYESPPVGQIAGAGANSVLFNVKCVDFAAPEECTASTEATVGESLQQIRDRMVGAPFNFPEPYLRNLMEVVDFDNGRANILGYTAYIEPRTDRYCIGQNGYFTPSTGRLVLCLAPSEEIGDSHISTLVHEYFHATQNDYTAAHNQAIHGTDEGWVVEGTAAAAAGSFFVDNRMSIDEGWGVHPVDVPITSTTSVDEYRAQDFFVYVGQHLGSGVNLGYLDSILIFGADRTAVDAGLQVDWNTDFQDQLWDWASNQVFEKEFSLDHELGNACTLEDAALKNGVQNTWQLLPPPRTSTWPGGTQEATVPPLTTLVVELSFPCNSTAEMVNLIYPQCAGLVGDELLKCYASAQRDLPGQFYEQTGTDACFDSAHGRVVDPELGAAIFENVTPSRRYFAVVTNTTDSDKKFQMGAELGCSSAP